MFVVKMLCTFYRTRVPSHNPNTAESAYELTEKEISDDVNLENNPAYSVMGALDRAEDHQYECIPANKAKQ